MPSFRRLIPDFQLANQIYTGAQVYAYLIDGDGKVTTQLATLYASVRGTTTIANPITLDGDGKMPFPVYSEDPIILNVVGATVGSHQTGVVQPGGTFRDTWAPGTTYVPNDWVTWGDPDYPTLYVVADLYVSRATIAEDIAAGDLVMAMNTTAVKELALLATDANNSVQLLKGQIDETAIIIADQAADSEEFWTHFRNGYYGADAAEPTTRPDGTAPQNGDSFLRTTAPIGLHYYFDGGWITPTSDAATIALKIDKLGHFGVGGSQHALVQPDPANDPNLAGFMSAADKAKLDGVAPSANAYVHPIGDGNRHVPAATAGLTGRWLRSPNTPGDPATWSTIGKADVGLNLVDNTPDWAKPISGATQNALNNKADLNGNSFQAFYCSNIYFNGIGWFTNLWGAKADLNGNGNHNFSANQVIANNYHINGWGWMTDLLNNKANVNGAVDKTLYAGAFLQRWEWASGSRLERNGAPAIYCDRYGDAGSVLSFSRSGNTIASISVSSSSVTYNTTSDVRLKEDFQDPREEVDAFFDALEIYDFRWKVDGTRSIGPIAQELYWIYPQAVSVGETRQETQPKRDATGNPIYDDEENVVMETVTVEEKWGVDHSKMVPHALVAIQMLREANKSLTQQLAAVLDRLAALESR